MTYLRINYKDTLPNPQDLYLLNVNNRNTRKRPDKCSKVTLKAPERRH